MGYVTKDLQQLNISQIDLILFHHPCSTNASNVAVWGFLQTAVKQKLVRSIGISNFNAGQMAALLEMTAKDPSIVPPSVNQCGMHTGGYVVHTCVSYTRSTLCALHSVHCPRCL